MLVALAYVRAADHVPVFAVAGEAGAADTTALLRAIHSVCVPLKVWCLSSSSLCNPL
jgi:hypothetical protein